VCEALLVFAVVRFDPFELVRIKNCRRTDALCQTHTNF
jgi:hypothetical protein